MNLIHSADDFLRMTQAYSNLQDCISLARTKNIPGEHDNLASIADHVRCQMLASVFVKKLEEQLNGTN